MRIDRNQFIKQREPTAAATAPAIAAAALFAVILSPAAHLREVRVSLAAVHLAFVVGLELGGAIVKGASPSEHGSERNALRLTLSRRFPSPSVEKLTGLVRKGENSRRAKGRKAKEESKRKSEKRNKRNKESRRNS